MAKVIFIGTSHFALPVLEGLVKNDYQILAVITAPDRPSGRKNQITPPPVKEIALKHKLRILQPEKISEIEKEISQINPDLIVVAAYGQIIPKGILDIPRFKSLNLHPSLLPKYRGPSPIQAAILNGDKITGATLMVMDEKMDHGPIVVQEEIEIKPEDNYQTLEKKLSQKSADLLIKNLPQYFNGKIKPKTQDETKTTYTKMLTRQDGEIDWGKSALENERKIRAFYPWPGAWTIMGGKRIKILKAKIIEDKLVPKIVQPEGKKPMAWDEFKKGHRPQRG
ncbi:MAG: methionyl-tRNA formyltransferase [Candidatus Portnoybacteria bacterium]